MQSRAFLTSLFIAACLPLCVFGADLLKTHHRRESILKLPAVTIGAAKIDITPEFPVRLSGYGNRRSESEGVAQRIWAKALAIGADGGDGPALLLTVENCGMTPAIREKVAARLKKEAGIANERLAITVSHSHTAPCLTNWAPYLFGMDISPDHQKHIDQYTELLADKMVEVALDALAKRRPARLSWAHGKVIFAGNRRVIKDGRWTGFGVQADGPVDHSLPIFVAKDTHGKLIAVVANYACHCTTLGGDFNQISGDWVSFAQEFIEKDHPGVVALITIGCGADANPNPRGNVAVCEKHGRALADEVARLLKGELEPIDPRTRCRLIKISLPFDRLPTSEEWKDKTKQAGAAGYHARKFLERVKAGEKIPSTLSYPVASWTFGNDLAMVFLGGEVVVDYAICLREEFDAERLWITAYANDVPCYIPSKRILREGGYEADRSMQYYARPTRLAESTEDLIVDTVQKVLPPEFYSKEKQASVPPPKSPEESLAAIKTKPGMIVELVAAEPLVVDPVAFDWGPDGRLWVVEMSDYPNGIGWNQEGDPLGKPGGRVKVLTDTDGDGQYDKASLFLDGISFPTGIKVWRNGVLVTAAPDIFYAEDANGDGKADKRETLYQGFGEGNQQHRVNGLRWGLDNWLYVGNGDSGGTIKSLKTGEEVNVSGRDLRIRPDQGLIETQSGQTQFGRCQDDHGNWFGGNNSNPMWHYVLDDRYLLRNPHFAPPDLKKQVSELPGAAPVFPLSKTLARFNDFDRADRFTSACSPIIFRDDSLIGTDFTIYAYVCEPVHNLVHREILHADGVTFTSRRADDEQQSEFLASEDNWFRPVMIRTGPDGALWIADMYRFVLEHPKWIPQDWQRKLDLRAGEGRGRIYRVRIPDIPNPTNWKTAKVPQLEQLTTGQLVVQLDSPNGTKRDMVQQMLLWRKDDAAIEPLKKLMTNAVWPRAVIHALYLLDELDALTDETLVYAMNRMGEDVSRHAIRLSERRANQSPEIGESYLKRLKVRGSTPFAKHEKLQLAYTLGEWSDSRAGEALATLALNPRDDPYIAAAVLSSVNEKNVEKMLSTVLSKSDKEPPPDELVKQLVRFAVALKRKEAVGNAVATLASQAGEKVESWHLAALSGLHNSTSRGGSSLADMLDQDSQQSLQKIVAQARELARNEKTDEATRLIAISLLGRNANEKQADIELLLQLLSPQNSPELQSTAVDSLGEIGDQHTAERLLKSWKTHSPNVRAHVMNALLIRESWTKQLLASLASSEISPSFIDAQHRQQLLQNENESIRLRAEALFSVHGDSNREQIVKQFQNVLTLAANEHRGKPLFEKHCSNCHRLNEVGHSVGADLAALTDKSASSLLVSILDPNRAIEEKFLGYVVVTQDGRQHSGMIISETSNAITLATAEGKQTVILRSELHELHSGGKSFMPEGLEKDCSPQQLADIIAYLRSTGPPRKQFPGNSPKVVTVDGDGRIRLLATNCKIYGSRLVFEQKYSNLGWWASESDRAVWSLVVPKNGRYRVILDYASDNAAAGDRYQLTVAGKTLEGVVEATGTWDNYRQKEIGKTNLPAGTADLVFQSKGRIKSALIDLRGITLVYDRDQQ